jgi:predicted Zn-dependent protease
MDALMNEILAHPALTATDIVQMADIYGNVPRLDRTIQLLRVCLQRFPSTTLAWYNLAAAHALRGECADCMMALGRAFAMDGPAGQLRAMARQDTRLERCRRDPLFQKTLTSF